MMRLLGIPFVKSDGEAEAMCAWLNENNVSYQARHCQSPVSECPCQGHAASLARPQNKDPYRRATYVGSFEVSGLAHVALRMLTAIFLASQ
jgi:hypothetical protein